MYYIARTVPFLFLKKKIIFILTNCGKKKIVTKQDSNRNNLLSLISNYLLLLG